MVEPEEVQVEWPTAFFNCNKKYTITIIAVVFKKTKITTIE